MPKDCHLMKLNRVFVLVAATLVLGNLLTLYIAAIAALPHERPALAGTVRFVLRVVRATGFVKLDTPEHVATLARIVIWLASIGEVGSIVWLASQSACVLSQRASADGQGHDGRPTGFAGANWKKTHDIYACRYRLCP